MNLRLVACSIAVLLAGRVQATPPAKSQKVLAVLELRNTLPQEEKATINMAYFSDMVRTDALEIAPAIQVMTRENVLVLLEATGKKLEDCEGECEVETGRRLGADLVISGEVYRVGPTLRLNLRLHDTRTGSLLAGAQAQGAGVAELDKSVRPACEKLLASLKSGPRPLAAGALVAPLRIWTTRDGTYPVQFNALNGSFSCEAPLSREKPCDITGMQPGFVHAEVRGDATLSADLTLNPVGGQLRLSSRGYGLTAASTGAILVGGAIGVLGFLDWKSELDTANATGISFGSRPNATRDGALIIAGGTVALAGVILLAVDFVKGHPWVLQEERE